MRCVILFLLTAFLGNGVVVAEETLQESLNSVLVRRAELMAKLQENWQEVQEGEVTGGKTKSVSRSVIYSAVIPGLGQFYSKSYIKAGIFAAVEIAAWATNIHYNNLGDDKDAKYRGFADQNWSEYRYWSYVNYLNSQRAEPLGDVYPYYQPQGTSWYLIEESIYGADVIAHLRTIENEFSGHTHSLPETKTQQYYEMIGKYPEQFGNAWRDASFDASYSGFEDRVTSMNDRYTNLSKEAESLYDKAGYGSMAALINHVISAVDAGFTTRSYNRRQMKLSYDNRIYNGEYVNMFGVDFIW